MHRAVFAALALACATARTPEPARESCGHALAMHADCERLRKIIANPAPPSTAAPVAVDVIPTSTRLATGKTPDEAVALFQAGKTAMNEARWDEAYDHFVRAYLLFPARVLLVSVGDAAEKSETRPGEALDAYRRFLATMPAPDKPADGKAEQRVRERLAALEAKTATLVLRDLAEGTEVTLDGRRRFAAKSAVSVCVYAGQHKVAASDVATWDIAATAGATHEHAFARILPAYCGESA